MPTILIVDDSHTDRALMVSTIQKARSEWTVQTAETGREALAAMQKLRPDLVVSDLRMPEMNGLELLDHIRRDDPELPVIIVTGQGSEGMAVEALKRGASSYVPKNQFFNQLVETIEQVFDRIRSDHNYQRLIGGLKKTEYQFVLENDPALLPALVDLLQQMAFGMEVVDVTERRRIGIALDEALLNAVYHGNLELPTEELAEVRQRIHDGRPTPTIEQRTKEAPYAQRKLHIDVWIMPHKARFVIRDEGMGFFPGVIPEAHSPKELEKQGGRGLVLMKSFMDEVTFNEMGNEVTLVKKKTK